MTEQQVGGTPAVAEHAQDSKLSDVTSSRVAPKNDEVPASQILWRIILPREDDPLDVRPLYLDEPETAANRCLVTSRRSVTVPASAKVSFSTYFNALPASYWKRWTTVNETVLRMTVKGAGRIDVYRSKANGDIVHLQGRPVRSTKAATTLEFRVSLQPFEDGGWIWFDVFTDDTALEIRDAAWTTEQELPTQRTAVGITTIRPADAVIALQALGEDPAVLDVVGKIVVVDQGPNQKVKDTPGFDKAAKVLGDKLEVIEQANLGGSGGFARVFYEFLENTNCEQVMLLDDDVRLEPDSVLRANAFTRALINPVVVGSHMMNLQARTRLHSMGEVVDLKECFWRAAPGAMTDHDFGTDSLRDTKELHARIHGTYNGWWMCSFPRQIVEEIGLPLPLFIKWDDAEYSLRALEHGYPTVSLPGSAIWHMPWTDKDDATDWTAYFHVRNRLIMAALHSPYDVRGTLLKQGLKSSLRHLFSMEYSTVMLHQKAIEDFLAGPDKLFANLPTALGEVRELRKGYTDAQILPSAGEFPAPTFDPVKAERLLKPPVNPVVIAARAALSLAHHLQEPSQEALDRPQINVPAQGARWFLLGALDSATVSNADGSGVAFRRRDPKVFRQLMARAAANHRRLVQEWPRLKRAYRKALPELTSRDAWKQTFHG
ncbi:glycosyltransferase [Crossiella cryophila]|uniref:Galactofuranosylgalactofuranosylrhamnosyl-N-acetylglucosaminyl-diphospho-decaprenol beta-1,5/1,6-galactofuranosyltransferase n=1 Tax=Crossiella cryophila TaxID=43355 RepID=A0A7W7FS69_9PSEU|nr:glycosyltransferase [Crossiella cryophila]MBB4675113.1 galactofuranosylgalactofuranosylrhamnosyl-N-acetylglucosaminyl-diphospho-decaprenol beta-1,5/1,6-galactofuranosyltransferase [Crossiella cryophila]